MMTETNNAENESTPLIESSSLNSKSQIFGLQFNLKTCMGVLLVVATGLLFTLANVIQKLNPGIHHFHLLAIRALVQMAVTSLYLRSNELSLLGPSNQRLRMFVQGILGGLLLCSIYIAVRRVPLGNGAAIFFSMPMFTFLFAATMINEPIRVYRTVIAVLLAIGVLNITRPPLLFTQYHNNNNGTQSNTNNAEYFDVVGYMFALAVPILSAVVSILTRQLRDVSPALIVFWFGAGALCVSLCGLVLSPAYSLSYTWLEWSSMVCVVALGIVGNVLYTLGVHWVTPSKANVFRSFEVVLNYMLQIYLENLAFHFSCVLGILALLMAVLLTGCETEVRHRFSTRYAWL